MRGEREGQWASRNGDIKGNPNTSPGLSVLPDGNVAMTKSWIRDAYELSQGAREHSRFVGEAGESTYTPPT